MGGMRGDDRQPDAMFSYVSAEQRVPADHPLRAIRSLVDDVLREMSGEFDGLYARVGRPSIPPERLLNQEIARSFFRRVVDRATTLMSDEHFTVDGTLIEAWASQKSFQRKDGPSGRDGREFRGESRTNDTHASK